jgi:hypothetical protein
LIGETFGPSKDELPDVQVTWETWFAGTAGTIVVVACSEGTSNRSEKIEGKCIMDADGSGLLSKKIPISTGFLRFIYFGMGWIEHQRQGIAAEQRPQ